MTTCITSGASSPEAERGFKLVDTIPDVIETYKKNWDSMVVMYLDEALEFQAEGLIAKGPRPRTVPPEEFIKAVTKHPYAWGSCWLKLSDDPFAPPSNIMYTWARDNVDNADVTREHKFCHGAYTLDVRNMLSPVKMYLCSSEDDFST
jgi:hypothetical protein